MKRSMPLFLSVLVLVSFLLTACGGRALPATATHSTDNQAEVEFTGKVEAIQDNQWTINGQVVYVSAEMAQNLPFQVGDEVKVTAKVEIDGSVRANGIVAYVAAPGNENANVNDNATNAGNLNANENTNTNSNANTNGNLNVNDNGNNNTLKNSNLNNNTNTNANSKDTGYDDNRNGNSNDDKHDDDNSNGDDDNDSNENNNNG